MYRDSQNPSFWTRILRALEASFHLGEFFGVQVRIYWLVLLVMPLICASQLVRSDFTSTLEIVILATLLFGALYVVVYTHEMSHIWAGWRYGIHTPLITLSPLGGVAHMASPAPNPRAEIWVAAAGPAVHLVWLAVFWPLSLLVPLDTTWGQPEGFRTNPIAWGLDMMVYLNLVLMGFNLLPLFPMDGGRILRGWLAGRMHGNRATLVAAKVGMVGAAILVAAGIAWLCLDLLSWLGLVLILIGFTNFVSCRHEARAARYQDSPYGSDELLEPWQTPSDSWKGGAPGTGNADGERPPGWWALRTERRRKEREDKERTEATELEEQLDDVLARISEVGMQNLTSRERAVLKRASKARRDTGA